MTMALLDIEAQPIEREKGYEPGEHTMRGLLQPLSLLSCKRAVIIGVSDAYAAEVASRMMSPTPTPNLYAMRGALRRYVQLFFASGEDLDAPDYGWCSVE